MSAPDPAAGIVLCAGGCGRIVGGLSGAEPWVGVCPSGRQTRLDGIPEDGYEPREVSAFFTEFLCRECAA